MSPPVFAIDALPGASLWCTDAFAGLSVDIPLLLIGVAVLLLPLCRRAGSGYSAGVVLWRLLSPLVFAKGALPVAGLSYIGACVGVSADALFLLLCVPILLLIARRHTGFVSGDLMRAWCCGSLLSPSVSARDFQHRHGCWSVPSTLL